MALKRAPQPGLESREASFVDALVRAARAQSLALPSLHDAEPFAALPYDGELELKQRALDAFWQDTSLPGLPDRLVPAPRPRGYRTTSKRRAVSSSRGVRLEFPGRRIRGEGPATSRLDAPEHVRLYDALADALLAPAWRALAAALHWVIVRGNGGQLALILNVARLDARVVRSARELAEELAKGPLGLRSSFLYLDPTRSSYYLERVRPESGVSYKRLFGPAKLQLQVDALRLSYPATVFSQVNESMVPTLIEQARTLLGPADGRELLDLYCGYGLFSLALGRGAARVTGVDHDGPAIVAARENAKYAELPRPPRFLAGSIDRAFLTDALRPAMEPELLFLDPPRQGTAPGVIEALAARRPQRVVHIACGIDELPGEVAKWRRAGYELKRARPLDLFAGTAGLETLLLFEPGVLRPPARLVVRDEGGGRTPPPRRYPARKRGDR